MMSLDNRAAHIQSDSHPVLLRRIEGFEELVSALRLEANSNVFHTKAHTSVLVPFGCDEQLSWSIVDFAHCVRSIPYEVQDHLLKLDSVASNGRQIVCKLVVNNYPVSLEVAQRQRNDLSGGLVQVH